MKRKKGDPKCWLVKLQYETAAETVVIYAQTPEEAEQAAPDMAFTKTFGALQGVEVLRELREREMFRHRRRPMNIIGGKKNEI